MRTHDREEALRPDEREHVPHPEVAFTAGPLAMRELARTIGNQAAVRMLGRMGVIEAVEAAKTGGAPGDEQELTRLSEEGQRFDPIGKAWVRPSSEKLWDTFYALHKKSTKFNLTYVDWETKQLAKGGGVSDDAKKVIDVTDDAALKALWGSSPVFDKWERANALASMFTKAGFEVEGPWESAPEDTSSKTPPVLFNVKGHKMISKFEVHPGGGIHKAAYIRISANVGMIKIINSASSPQYDPLQEKVLKYVQI